MKIERCEPDDEQGGLGSEISAMFREVGLEEPIAELRGFELAPISFEPDLSVEKAVKRVARRGKA